MRRIDWFGLQRLHDQRFDLIISDFADRARPRFINKPIKAMLNEP
jgi:hypothetical protein